MKVLMDTCDSDLFFWYLCFSPWASLQFGPFLDSKHEQVEVSVGLGWGGRRSGYLHPVEPSFFFISWSLPCI